ncbi:MAG: 3-ketoacyl-ACP reductase [Bacteroidota bacterium]
MKTALVTGGSRGIGLGITKALLGKGYQVGINGVRDESAVVELLKELRTGGGAVEYVQGDIGSADDRRRMVETLKQKFGSLNVLVNNAGVAPRERKDVLEITEDDFDYMLGINLKGTYFLTQEIIRWMIEQKGKAQTESYTVVNITSISAEVASINRGEYCIAKAGLSMMSKLMAIRLGEIGIPVFEVRPGVIETDMTSGVKAKYEKLINEGLLVEPRMGQPKDIGKIVAALASGDIPYSTGQILTPDGGLMIQRL